MGEHQPASIARIEYDAARQRLAVTFTSGPILVQVGVRGGIHASFAAADHQGASYVEHIRDLYPRA